MCVRERVKDIWGAIKVSDQGAKVFPLRLSSFPTLVFTKFRDQTPNPLNFATDWFTGRSNVSTRSITDRLFVSRILLLGRSVSGANVAKAGTLSAVRSNTAFELHRGGNWKFKKSRRNAVPVNSVTAGAALLVISALIESETGLRPR